MAGKLETFKVLEELGVCILSDGAERAAVRQSQGSHFRQPEDTRQTPGHVPVRKESSLDTILHGSVQQQTWGITKRMVKPA